MKDAIKIINVSKNFDSNAILSNVNMTIKKGEIYGLLGINGAGKTTLMKILLSLVTPDMGVVEILGKEINSIENEIFSKVGSIIEYPIFYDNLTAKQNLEIHCDYIGERYKTNISKYLQLVGLQGADKKPIKNFSLGMKQRLGLARALIHEPEILILDEPINGLDPKGIMEIRELLLKLNQEQGTTILMSSHIISEVDKLVHKIGIIDNGNFIEELSIDNVRADNIDLEEYFLNILKRGN